MYLLHHAQYWVIYINFIYPSPPPKMREVFISLIYIWENWGYKKLDNLVVTNNVNISKAHSKSTISRKFSGRVYELDCDRKYVSWCGSKVWKPVICTIWKIHCWKILNWKLIQRGSCRGHQGSVVLRTRCPLCVLCVQSLQPMDCSHQAPVSMGFSRLEYWSGLPCPPPGDLPNPGIEPVPACVSCIAGGFLTHWATWEAHSNVISLMPIRVSNRIGGDHAASYQQKGNHQFRQHKLPAVFS